LRSCQGDGGGINRYFLSEGILAQSDVDLEAFFNKIERMTTIYISRNTKSMIFTKNTFA